MTMVAVMAVTSSTTLFSTYEYTGHMFVENKLFF